jgi:N utilization substance protein B
MKPESRRDMRALAFHFIYAVDRFDKGAIEMQEQADEIIKPLLRNWKLERLGCCTRLILRLAIWELHQSDAMPSIVINEAIELAKCFAEKDAYKFINGILDEASKKLHPDSQKGETDEPQGDVE